MDILKPYYKNYCKNVSPDNQALSFKASVYCYNYCVKNKPRKIIDLGSGFTSFVLRLYQKNFSTEDFKIYVYSVDDNKKWLNKTYNFLKNNKVNTDNLLFFRNTSVPVLEKNPKYLNKKNGKYNFLNDDLVLSLENPKNSEYIITDFKTGENIKESNFDFIIYDMGLMITRGINLKNAMNLLDKNGNMFIDDLQFYEKFVKKIIKDHAILKILKEETLDNYSRYCGICNFI